MQLSELLRLHRPYNSTWEVLQLGVMPSGHTPWGVLRSCLREIAARRDAIRDQAVAAEDARRARFWALLTLRPMRAKACALRAQEAERRALMLAEQLEALAYRAKQLRQLLPAQITPEAEMELDRLEGLEALARSQGDTKLIRARLDPLSAAAWGGLLNGDPDKWQDALYSICATRERAPELLEGAWK